MKEESTYDVKVTVIVVARGKSYRAAAQAAANYVAGEVDRHTRIKPEGIVSVDWVESQKSGKRIG